MSSHRSWTEGGGSVGSTFNKRSLRLLVCSGNLGNAAPDLYSLASWIPYDGACSSVLVESPRYPIPSKESLFTFVPDDHLHSDGQEVFVEGDEDDSAEDEATRQFELIVVGLQESTFDVNAVAEEEDDPNNGGAKSTLPSSLGELPSALVELPTSLGKNVAKAGIKAGFSTANTAKRGLTAVKTLATSKDYVKNRARLNSQEASLINIASRATNALNELTADGTQILHAMLTHHLPSYHHIVSFQRGEMRLEIFALKDKDEEADDEEDDPEKTLSTVANPSWVKVLSVKAQNTGRGGLANKGGILAQLLVGNTTRLSFMTAHLEAHEGRDKYKMRVGTLADILSGTQTDTRFDASLTSHTMFALGDLNFRTELNLTEGEEYDKDKQMEMVLSWVKEQNWEKLNEFDELQHALRNKDCLVGFQTLPCLFPPTFKVERKAGYTYKGNRRPSYTDRILWKSIPSNFASGTLDSSDHGNVRPLIYEPIDNFSTSDHKPIRGAFEVRLNERLRLRPAMHKWQSKRGRSRSLGKSTKEKTTNGSVHVFVREMQCQISRSNYTRLGSTTMPDPYLCFMSRPKELIRMEQRKWKHVLKSVFSCTQSAEAENQNEGGPVARSTLGWPRSRKMWGTYEPYWEDEEVHFTLQAHDQEGLPLDLAGALMYITLLDHGATLEDHLIGSAVLNLHDVFTATHPLCQKAKVVPQHDNQQQHLHPPSSQRSTRSLFSSHARASAMSEVSVISSYRIDEPLVKNGKEMGRIQCSIDAWWVDDHTARSAAIRRVSNVSLLAETSDHPHIALASRRRVNPPQTELIAGSGRAKKGIRFWRTDD